jgi:hypothetical protein
MPDYIFIDCRGHLLDEATYESASAAQGHAERLAMEHRSLVAYAEVVAYRVQPICMLCTQPATIRAGDWELCDDCHNAVVAPDPVCDECGEPLTSEDIEAGETLCPACAPEAALSAAFLVEDGRIVEVA